MQQSSDKPQKHRLSADQGLAYFPLSNMQFDVINIIAEKSKALKAYDHYLRDCQPNSDLVQVLEGIAADDRRHIEELRKHLDT